MSDDKVMEIYNRVLEAMDNLPTFEETMKERQRLHEWNMKQMEEWSKTKEQKLEEMLAQTTERVLSYCFNIDKERCNANAYTPIDNNK